MECWKPGCWPETANSCCSPWSYPRHPPGWRLVAGGRFGALEIVAPSVLALAVWSSGLHVGGNRDRFRAAVRSPGAACRHAPRQLRADRRKSFAVILIMVGQVTILAGVALALGWRPAFTVLSGARPCCW